MLLVYVQGEYLRGQVPHQIYPVIVTASLVVDASWNGTGVFTNGSHIYNDCKVTNVTGERASSDRRRTRELAVSLELSNAQEANKSRPTSHPRHGAFPPT